MQEIKFNLILNDHKLISAVQKQFNDAFPFLKIEFFKKSHEAGEGSARHHMYDPSLSVRNIQSKKGPARVTVSSRMKVHDFEQQLTDMFGLHVQVFRKSGNIWLETSATDKWTLEEQNEEGRLLQQQLKPERENPEDHDMYG